MDREKVIKGLACKLNGTCSKCPYDEDFNCIGCIALLRDALELLKAQEPKQMHVTMDDLISRAYILEALSIFNDSVNGDPHFLNGIETAKEITEGAPTIDAIPVEWLKEKRNDELHKLAENVYGRLEDELCIAIIRVLELWKEEQEGR